MGTSCDIYDSGISCGVDAVSSMSGNVDDMLRDIADHYLRESHCKGHNTTAGFTNLIWSDVVGKKTKSPGQKLALRLSRLFPGTVISTTPQVNANTGNKIKTWVWGAKPQPVRKWIKEKYPRIMEQWALDRRESRGGFY